MIVLKIPVPTPSLNKTRYRHWSAYYAQKKAWREEIWAAKARFYPGQAITPPSRAKVRIERYGKQMLDHDNFIGGLKPVIDALKLHALITDDSPDRLELDAQQFVGLPAHTVITVEAA